jgi:integrase/recombinase XerD
MLDHYYVRPKTADRIRGLWLGPAIDRYAAWMTERGAAKATVTRNLQALIHFDQFARTRRAMTWADLPALVEPFVDQWMREHGTWCTSARARQSLRSHPRTPVEQTLRLLIPGFIGTTTRRPVPFQETAPDFFEYLRQERGLRPATLYQYVYHLRVFEAYLRRLGIGAVGEISPALLTTFLMEPGLQGRPLGPDGMQGRGGGAARVSPLPPSTAHPANGSQSRGSAATGVSTGDAAARHHLGRGRARAGRGRSPDARG